MDSFLRTIKLVLVGIAKTALSISVNFAKWIIFSYPWLKNAISAKQDIS